MLPFFFFYSPAEKISVDLNEVEDYAVFANILLAAILLSGITYAALSFHLLRRHQAKIEDNFSYTEGISLQWLRVCIIAMALIFLTAAIVIVMRDVFHFSFPFNPEFAFYLLMISFILYVGYFGIRFENILYSPSPASMGTQEAPAEKYVKSGIRAEEAREGYQKLLRYMEKEKPFLQPKLSLTALADCLGMSTNQLSQIINQQAGVHFHDFINSYRMQEFIKLAEMNKHYSLLALAFEAGFNSKSSFNLVFKRQTGLSPSQYLASKASTPQERL
jgi:AraC-like DNA-binding protein